MKYRDHQTAEEARSELVRNGYVDIHTKPEQPQLWGKPGHGERLAIEAGYSRYHIVNYADYQWLA